jgi:hypothetical protein
MSRVIPAVRAAWHRDQRGFAMLLAMLLIAILSVIGATTLSVAGVDQRIALHNRKHMMVMNTSDAGTEHARYQLEHENPPTEGLDPDADTWPDFVQSTEGEEKYEGLEYAHNLGVYWVQATYQRCGNPPPGYSTEIGNTKFRSDYWEMKSQARMQDTSYSNINETSSTTALLLRKVVKGTCKVR